MLQADPYQAFPLPAGAKRIVTFLEEPPVQAPALPMRADGASLLLLQDLHLFSAYVPGPKAAAFMVLIGRTFGKDVTTRTWDTVRKVCAAGTR